MGGAPLETAVAASNVSYPVGKPLDGSNELISVTRLSVGTEELKDPLGRMYPFRPNRSSVVGASHPLS
jgi:hypothetical protein